MTLTIPPEVIEAHRPVLADWVQANGIDPRTVPLHHPIRVEEGEGGTVIVFRAFVLDEHGNLKLDPNQHDEVMTVQHTAPCTVPPPDLGASEADARGAGARPIGTAVQSACDRLARRLAKGSA